MPLSTICLTAPQASPANPLGSGEVPMIRRLLLIAIAGFAMGGEASAQSTGQRIVIERPAPVPQTGMVRVQASIHLLIPGPTDDSEDAEKQRDRARRVIYEMAAKECDLLRDVIAKDCRLESITSNLSVQPNQNAARGYNVNGTMSLQITLK
jgi:hypothetical protein